jgi:cyclopropane-fatty-acyl-phospholipid synthase
VLENIVANVVTARLRQLELPRKVQMWNGAVLKEHSAAKVEVAIRSFRALLSFLKPTLGSLARQYVERRIDLKGNSQDIVRVGEALCRFTPHAGSAPWLSFRWWRSFYGSLDEKIRYHYDISDDFFALWLDRNRVYSCGYYKTFDDDLELAQEQKLEHICRKLQLHPGERFLDIGCGWGALLFWAAQRFGVQATGVTLSHNQFDYVRNEIGRRGLRKQCEVYLMDYRDLQEENRYDKIASVGMFEHVGEHNLALYFAKVGGLLKPGGLVMNHGIMSVDVAGSGLGSNIGEFIERYVFPGGTLVHISKVLACMARESLEILDVESLRRHYAKTLWHWVQRLETKKPEACALVGEDRFRTWQIYMAGSAYAFEKGWLTVMQILAGKPLADGSLLYPLTREHVYATSKFSRRQAEQTD